MTVCIELDNDFSILELLATSLNGLDVRFRYPDMEFEPDTAEVQQAIFWATRILNFVGFKTGDVNSSAKTGL